MAWSTSDRRHRLPKDWPTVKTQVKARAHGRCEATHHHPHCDGHGTEVDHINPGDNHDLANLQLLSQLCHQVKTDSETAARNKLNAKLRRKPTEEHPGRIQS